MASFIVTCVGTIGLTCLFIVECGWRPLLAYFVAHFGWALVIMMLYAILQSVILSLFQFDIATILFIRNLFYWSAAAGCAGVLVPISACIFGPLF